MLTILTSVLDLLSATFSLYRVRVNTSSRYSLSSVVPMPHGASGSSELLHKSIPRANMSSGAGKSRVAAALAPAMYSPRTHTIRHGIERGRANPTVVQFAIMVVQTLQLFMSREGSYKPYSCSCRNKDRTSFADVCRLLGISSSPAYTNNCVPPRFRTLRDEQLGS